MNTCMPSPDYPPNQPPLVAGSWGDCVRQRVIATENDCVREKDIARERLEESARERERGIARERARAIVREREPEISLVNITIAII